MLPLFHNLYWFILIIMITIEIRKTTPVKVTTVFPCSLGISNICVDQSNSRNRYTDKNKK